MSAFDICAFGECAFESQSYHGEWLGIYSFEYEAGATVYVTPVISTVIPIGTSLHVYASEDSETWTELTTSVKSYVTFVSKTSGITNIYIKITMDSSMNGITPVVTSLGLLIHQETSLYTIATQVMSDGLTNVGADWYIDEELQKFPIPYSWLESMSHRQALGKIAEVLVS